MLTFTESNKVSNETSLESPGTSKQHPDNKMSDFSKSKVIIVVRTVTTGSGTTQFPQGNYGIAIEGMRRLKMDSFNAIHSIVDVKSIET